MRKIYLLGCLGIVISCNSSHKSNVKNQIQKDSITNSNKDDSLEDGIKEHYEIDQAKTNEKIIQKEYGIQWDFCDCIVKNDSIQKAIDLAGDIDDSEFEALMNRFEEIDQHCKSIIASPSTTPDDRIKHERRVKKCLTKAAA